MKSRHSLYLGEKFSQNLVTFRRLSSKPLDIGNFTEHFINITTGVRESPQKDGVQGEEQVEWICQRLDIDGAILKITGFSCNIENYNFFNL